MSDFEIRQARIEFPDDATTDNSVLVVEVGPNQFRLENYMFGIESASYKDVVEVEPRPSGVFLFKRVLAPGNWKEYSFFLAKEEIESPGFGIFLDRLSQQGVHWERLFGGLLVLCTPPEMNLDLAAEVAAALQVYR